MTSEVTRIGRAKCIAMVGARDQFLHYTLHLGSVLKYDLSDTEDILLKILLVQPIISSPPSGMLVLPSYRTYFNLIVLLCMAASCGNSRLNLLESLRWLLTTAATYLKDHISTRYQDVAYSVETDHVRQPSQYISRGQVTSEVTVVCSEGVNGAGEYYGGRQGSPLPPSACTLAARDSRARQRSSACEQSPCARVRNCPSAAVMIAREKGHCFL